MNDLIPRHSAVRMELLLFGCSKENIDHDPREARGHPNLDAVLVLQLVGHLDNTRQQVGVFRQTFDLHRHEVTEHRIHIALVGIGAVGSSPAFANGGDLGQRLDMKVFAQAHRAASFAHRDLHTVLTKDIYENDRWSEHICVGNCPAPIEDDTPGLCPCRSW